MKKDLVFEIGTEELPASCVEAGTLGLEEILKKKLTQNRIDFVSVKTFGSPRRLAAIVSSLAETQRSEEKVITGPPKKIAFGKDGTPTKAAIGFAKSLNINVSSLEEIEINRGTYIGKKIVEEGKKTSELLPGILKDSVLSLMFPKQMTWGDYSIKFARPIRWMLALFGGDVINFAIENLTSGNVTFGHRTLNPEPITVDDAGSYLKLLEDKGKVIVDFKKRMELIIDGLNNIRKNTWNGEFEIVSDKDLLNEVVNLVEIPNVLVGNFSKRFLYIPKEILTKVIQHHQKYFAVIDKAGNVSTQFVVVQNGIEDKSGEIINGNEKVLGARLSDAVFFYEEDKKHDFDSWCEKLKGVIFYSNLGSIYDKACRLKEICLHINSLLKDKDILKNDNIHNSLSRAAMFCKCDLVTNMVVEFPELQGTVGKEYARERGEKFDIPESIFEHYLPRFSEDVLPATDVGSILSIADKIDTISGMFLAGNIPSGSEDPFALRRKASGIVLSVLKKKYDLDMEGLISYSLELYIEKFNFKDISKEEICREIKNFIIARYRFMLEKKNRRLDVLEAILASGGSSILDIDLRYKAIEKFIKEKDIETISTPMVRCKNIIKGKTFSNVNARLLSSQYEKKLFSSVTEKRSIIVDYVEKKQYGCILAELGSFGKGIDAFFDNVLVMDKDEKVRDNRINLVKVVMDLYLLMADFSKLVIEGNKIH